TAKVYSSEEEAQANKPQGEKAGKARLYSVTAPGGASVWTWAVHGGTSAAVYQAAYAAGWRAHAVGKPVGKDEVGAMLARLTPEDRAILIQQYVPAPAATAAKGGRTK